MLVVKCQDYFLEQVKFAIEANLLDQLLGQLNYLGTYANGEGGSYDTRKGKNTICELYEDFAKHSFAFNMFRQSDPEAKPESWFIGGLIYEGPDQPLDGSFPALTVSVGKPKIGWGVHT